MSINKYLKKYMVFIISLIISIQNTSKTHIYAEDINEKNNISNISSNSEKCKEGNVNIITDKHISLLKFSAGTLILEVGPRILSSMGKILGKGIGKIIVIATDSLTPTKIILACTSFGSILGILVAVGIGTYLIGDCLYKFIITK